MTLATHVPARPVIFSTPMVKAILEGRKTQTRRIIKPQPYYASSAKDIVLAGGDRSRAAKSRLEWVCGGSHRTPEEIATYCPHGTIGSRLWVKETWTYDSTSTLSKEVFCYKADNPDLDTDWRNVRFMPKRASRVLLEITDVRVQRLQEISEQDAMFEGCRTRPCRRCNETGIEQEGEHKGQGCEDCSAQGWFKCTDVFREVWSQINGKKPGCDWASNPWVWAITFKRVNPAK